MLSSTLISNVTVGAARLSLVRMILVLLIVTLPLPSALFSQTSALPPDLAQTMQDATAALREGRLDDAVAGLQAVVKASPTFAEAHFNLGLVYQQQGKYEDAIASFQKALKIKPRLHGANLFLGISELRLNHFDQAVAALQKETTAYPKEAPAWMWLGVVWLAEEKPEKAIEALDAAYKLDPANTDVLYHRGRAHLQVSKDSYLQMFKLDPKSWRVHQVLAQTDAESEHHEEAVAEYLEAIKLAPQQPGLHEELGTEYRILVKLPEAEAAFRQELEIDPNNVLARYKLGVMMVEKGEAKDGKQLIEDALKDKPGLRNSDYNLGRAEMQLGNDEKAVDDFKRALKGDSEAEIIRQSWYQLGTVLRRMRRTAEAQQAFAMYQRLKDEEEADLQTRKRKRALQQEQLNGEPVAQPAQPQPDADKPQPQ
jgi:tetratricopeptide (TPR) repeat protein